MAEGDGSMGIKSSTLAKQIEKSAQVQRLVQLVRADDVILT